VKFLKSKVSKGQKVVVQHAFGVMGYLILTLLQITAECVGEEIFVNR